MCLLVRNNIEATIRWLTEIGDTDVIVLNRNVLISGWPELVYKGNYKDTSLLISTTKQPEELSQILIKYIYRTDFLQMRDKNSQLLQ